MGIGPRLARLELVEQVVEQREGVVDGLRARHVHARAAQKLDGGLARAALQKSQVVFDGGSAFVEDAV